MNIYKLQEKANTKMLKEIENREPNQPISIYASKIGHPCTAYLYHSIINYKMKRKFSVKVKKRLDAGREIAKLKIRELEEKWGLDVEHLEYPCKLTIPNMKYNISGIIDAIFRERGKKTLYPFEIKTIERYNWTRLNALEDFWNAKNIYYNLYPAQIISYMEGGYKGKKFKEGYLVLINMGDWDEYVIKVKLNDPVVRDYIKTLKERAIIVNKAIEKGEPPQHIDFKPWMCENCDFKLVCLPDMQFTGTDVIFDKEFEEYINNYFKIEDEYKNMAKPIIDEKEEMKKHIAFKVEKLGNKIHVGINVATITKILIEPKGKQPYTRLDIDKNVTEFKEDFKEK